MEIIFQFPKLNFYMWPWCHIPTEDMATSHLVAKSFHFPLGQEMLRRGLEWNKGGSPASETSGICISKENIAAGRPGWQAGWPGGPQDSVCRLASNL